MKKDAIDLHTHTSCSDGTYSPDGLVRLAAQKGLRAIAITDHDTVSGVEEALNAGIEHGVDIIPGVEISAQYEVGVLHILGYFIDIHCGNFLSFLQGYIDSRNRRNPQILEKLQTLGYPLEMEEITELSGGEVINRPHFAQAMVNRGYVQSRQEAFDRFLGQGEAAYIAKEVFTASEAVQRIHEAGGLAVLAHPALLNAGGLIKTGNEIERLHEAAGFDGIEAYHGDCICDYAQFYASIADKLGLFVTGGSDFHGDSKHYSIGGTRCLSHIPYKLVEDMKAVLDEKISASSSA